MPQKTAVIIGAGPAGLTAAYELLTRTDILPIVLEADDHVGGLAATIEYKGNRIDIGGHRFFSKSDRVMDWWLHMMPLQKLPEGEAAITYHGKTRPLSAGAGPDPDGTDRVMLLRNRLSRIYFLRKFFPYPIRLDLGTLRKLGVKRTVRIFISYVYASLFPVKPEKTLEDFFINRFGRELYQTFFKSYTEKVWGVSCTELTAEWGAQRVKGLSLWKALRHFAKSLIPQRAADVSQKQTETSLIERFLYPKFGPGQMWQVVAESVQRQGGTVLLNHEVRGIQVNGAQVVSVTAFDKITGKEVTHHADYVFSTMPMKALVQAMGSVVPVGPREVGEGLRYRDFITVGVLVKQLVVKGSNGEKLIRDNWMYIQEPDVMVGRIQVFNNWSPALVAKPDTVWLGLEYFCNQSDPLWNKTNEAMIAFATEEIARIGLIRPEDVLDATVLRVPKTYPAYTGTYDRLNELRTFVNGIENLFLVGRNGMHRYNNQDHSMLTAMIAVDNILAGRTDKSNIWEVNTEQEYHEHKS